MLTDGFPTGGIFRNSFSINDGVVEQEVTGVTMADNVDGIIFDTGFAVEIFVDLVKRIALFFENQHVGVFVKLFNDLVGIFHIIADDDKFAFFNGRFFGHRKSIGENNFIGIVSFGSKFVGILCIQLDFNFVCFVGIFGHDVVKVFNFNIFHRFGKFFSKFGALDEFLLKIAVCIIGGSVVCVKINSRIFTVFARLLRRRDQGRRFFVIGGIITLRFDGIPALNRRSSRCSIHDFNSTGSIKEHALFELLDSYSLLSQHFFCHDLFLPVLSGFLYVNI